MAAQRLSNVLSHITPGGKPLDKMYALYSPFDLFSRVHKEYLLTFLIVKQHAKEPR